MLFSSQLCQQNWRRPTSDLSNMDLRYMKVLPDGIQFDPAELAKQSRPSKPVASFLFPAFPSYMRLCPKATIQAYLRRTEAYRGTGNNRKSRVLLSYVKPHNLNHIFLCGKMVNVTNLTPLKKTGCHRPNVLSSTLWQTAFQKRVINGEPSSSALVVLPHTN